MHLPEQEQCFAASKIGNGHVWQLDSNIFIVNHSVAYHLVTLLGNYVHWSCEMSNLRIPDFRDVTSAAEIDAASSEHTCSQQS